MKTRTVTVCEGELLGPIDWSHDFASHGWDRDGCTNPECVAGAVEELRKLDDHNGQGSIAIHETRLRVIAHGMYDGWPYWRPIPSVCVLTAFGAEWHSFLSVRDFQPPEVNQEALGQEPG